MSRRYIIFFKIEPEETYGEPVHVQVEHIESFQPLVQVDGDEVALVGTMVRMSTGHIWTIPDVLPTEMLRRLGETVNKGVL